MIICPNEDCLKDIDVSDPFNDAGQYDEQESMMECPECGARLAVTTHITYSAELAAQESSGTP